MMNFATYMPAMNTMMAEDSNTPALRRLMNFHAKKINQRKKASDESNEQFLKMLTCR